MIVVVQDSSSVGRIQNLMGLQSGQVVPLDAFDGSSQSILVVPSSFSFQEDMGSLTHAHDFILAEEDSGSFTYARKSRSGEYRVFVRAGSRFRDMFAILGRRVSRA